MKTVPKNNDNILKYLRNHHQQQIDKLLMKNQLEIDIVEEIRSFVKQKCNLDKNYAESLLKLSTNFQNKKLANIPNILRIEQKMWPWEAFKKILSVTRNGRNLLHIIFLKVIQR